MNKHYKELEGKIEELSMVIEKLRLEVETIRFTQNNKPKYKVGDTVESDKVDPIIITRVELCNNQRYGHYSFNYRYEFYYLYTKVNTKTGYTTIERE